MVVFEVLNVAAAASGGADLIVVHMEVETCEFVHYLLPIFQINVTIVIPLK